MFRVQENFILELRCVSLQRRNHFECVQSFECVRSKIIHHTTLRTAFCSSRVVRDDVVDATCSCNTVDRWFHTLLWTQFQQRKDVTKAQLVHWFFRTHHSSRICVSEYCIWMNDPLRQWSSDLVKRVIFSNKYVFKTTLEWYVLICETLANTNSICGVYMFTLGALTRSKPITSLTHFIARFALINYCHCQFTSTSWKFRTFSCRVVRICRTFRDTPKTWSTWIVR